MATTLAFKDIIDLPEWRPLAVSPNASGAGVSLACDLRNSEDRHPEIFQLVSNAVLNAYHVKNDGWAGAVNPGLAGTFGAGAGEVFMTRGPRGTLAAACTTTKLKLTTALPAAIAPNQLAGRGDGQGYKVRVIGNAAGSSGKVEERYIIANTSGTTPDLVLDSALSFTPVSGDAYEFISGRVYCLGAGTTAAGTWKAYDILTSTMLANLVTTNLPATISTDSSFVGLDEQFVPYNRAPGEGFFGNLIATGTAAGTITGQASAGDASVWANEYRNFQVRIVQDTAIPTAAGQRRVIASHTAGASPVYTLSGSWTVTPSATATFVIENANWIILFTSGVVTVYTYAQDAIGGMSADTWSSSQFGARGTAMGAGCSSFQSFGLVPDADKNARHSYIYSFRGAAGLLLDVLDIAGGANGTWTNGATYAGQITALTTGSCITYSPSDNYGKFAYLSLNGGQFVFRFNAFTRNLNQWAQIRYTQGAAVVGNRVASTCFVDGATKVGFVFLLRSSGAELFNCLIQR